MEKQEFFDKIQEALREYYRNTPCQNCTISDDMDDCINCHKRHIDNQLWDNVKRLKAEYKKQFGTYYDDDYRDLMIKNYRETSKKANITDFLNKYFIEDILKIAVELGKTDKMVSLDKACEVFSEMLMKYNKYIGHCIPMEEWENRFRKRLEE